MGGCLRSRFGVLLGDCVRAVIATLLRPVCLWERLDVFWCACIGEKGTLLCSVLACVVPQERLQARAPCSKAHLGGTRSRAPRTSANAMCSRF
uniref:Putative secreted protein n=1 Tax=Ixodes ricinus TaxID=34613 RepID=A0A6B0UCM9_IXORI